jgi:hypothetical protein
MNSIRRISLVLSIAALFAVPSVASASSSSSVDAKLAKASDALDAAVVAAEENFDKAAFLASAADNQRFTKNAERSAKKERKKAKRAKLLAAVADQHDQNLNEYAALIEWVPADLQFPVVDMLGISVEMREVLIDKLMQLAEKLPEPARTQILDAIAMFQSDGDLESLLEAFASEDVIGGVKALIQEQINTISEHMDAVLSQLEQLTGMLPPQAAQAVNSAIAMIQAHLTEVSGLIGELLDGLGGDGGFLGGFGGFGGGSLCDLLGGFPIPVPICD